MSQRFSFRSQAKLPPLYNLVATITAEELGHVEFRDDALENRLIPN
nr:manganese catalase family protein [Lichenicola cladoniae]